MKIERLKTYLLSVTAGCLLALPWSASAFTVYEDFVSLGSSVPATPVVFEGAMQANMTQCDLELDAELIVYGSTVEINVVGGAGNRWRLLQHHRLAGFPMVFSYEHQCVPDERIRCNQGAHDLSQCVHDAMWYGECVLAI